MLAAYRHGTVVAGGVLSSSPTVVGISNVFVGLGADLDPWPGCLAFAGELFPGKPVVGYQSGGSLLQAERNGFQTAGPLRVWINDRGAKPASRKSYCKITDEVSFAVT
jgi:hypothetical protein